MSAGAVVEVWPFYDAAGTQPSACDCDLCEDHYVWECPACNSHHDHYQAVDFPLEEQCSCGVTMRLTATTAKKWCAAMGVQFVGNEADV